MGVGRRGEGLEGDFCTLFGLNDFGRKGLFLLEESECHNEIGVSMITISILIS